MSISLWFCYRHCMLYHNNDYVEMFWLFRLLLLSIVILQTKWEAIIVYCVAGTLNKRWVFDLCNCYIDSNDSYLVNKVTKIIDIVLYFWQYKGIHRLKDLNFRVHRFYFCHFVFIKFLVLLIKDRILLDLIRRFMQRDRECNTRCGSVSIYSRMISLWLPKIQARFK